jgi:hypothetical protein
LGFEIEKCDCATFIDDKKSEAKEAISGYNLKIKEANELIEELEAIKEKSNPNYKYVRQSFKEK